MEPLTDGVNIIILNISTLFLDAVAEHPPMDAPPTKKARLIREVTTKQRGYIIEGRVKSKTEVKDFRKGSEDEKLFTFIIYDESSEISVLAINDICETWYQYIEIGSCYRLTRLTAKSANQLYNKTGHACELQMSKVNYSLT